MEREWLDRLYLEKKRNRTKERENKNCITNLTKELKIEQNNVTREMVRIMELKKSNSELRKKMQDLVIKNSQLKKEKEKWSFVEAQLEA